MFDTRLINHWSLTVVPPVTYLALDLHLYILVIKVHVLPILVSLKGLLWISDQGHQTFLQLYH